MSDATDHLPDDLPKPGDRLLGKFRIDRVLGQGGAGVVYAAHHELLDQSIALKLLLAEPGSEAAHRFVNEAKLAARIHSEHVCRVMDVGTLESGVPYIAMEYLEGHDLDAAVVAGALPVELACDYVLQALDAVAQAHAQGIVHRDLKPSNLFLALRAGGTPIVKVLDFGISKGDMLGTESNVTSSRAILGSPSYMSPEQIKNARTVDARTDIWSLGVILFELATGHPPFGGETVGEVFAKIIEADPPSPRSLVADLPEEFEAAVRKCLARERDDRFANVAELAEAIAPFASETSVTLLSRIRAACNPNASSPSGLVVEPPPSRARQRSVASATAAPWTEAAPPAKRRSRLLLVPVAFLLGGATVFWFLASRPHLLSEPTTAASSFVATALDAGATIETTIMGTSADSGGATPTVATPTDVDASANADLIVDASTLDAGDAGDASDDDGGLEEDEEDDDADAAVAAGTGTRHSAPNIKKTTRQRTPGKTSPTRKKTTKKKR